MAGGSRPTRQSSRERVQTPKARDLNSRQLRAGTSDTEDTIEVIDSAPAPPLSKQTEINGHFRGRTVATKVRALAAKAEPPAASAMNNSSGTTTNAQIKILTDLVRSLVESMEEQKQMHQDREKGITNGVEKCFPQALHLYCC